MSTPQEKLAQSLAVLKKIQDRGVIAINTNDLTRTHRERLINNGFLREVMKGWYIQIRPDEPEGESTAWYASFWGFCSGYLQAKFGDQWCLSPEQSLSIHSGNWSVPGQLLVRTPKGGNKPIFLLHDTSIMDVRLKLPEKNDLTSKDNLRLMTLPTALLSCSANYYRNNPVEARAVLSMISEASEILPKLLDGGHSTIAGRLAGALRNIGRGGIADNIVETMRAAGYSVTENDPFEEKANVYFSERELSPYVNRMRMNWLKMRGIVIDHFPRSSSFPGTVDQYLQHVDDVFLTDAYHSLSIEGYRVSEGLIDRVRSGEWNPEVNRQDKEYVDALAARGYWQAFQAVKKSVEKVLKGDVAGQVVSDDHAAWYRELFSPSVSAGINVASDLAGYRNHLVYIRKSMHVPPRCEAVRDLMPAFFALLSDEDEPAVRAVLGHFFFVYIHPYMDGNGRMGRFLMNVMLAGGGYSWAIIPHNTRAEYMATLEQASVHQNIEPFTKFLARCVGAEGNDHEYGVFTGESM